MNKYRPHLLVVPEDDANRQLANGFATQIEVSRYLSIAPPPGGWPKVLAALTEQHIATMRQFPERHLVLLIDFDGEFATRLARFVRAIPADLADRIYVIGTSEEPENLKSLLGISFERIGEALADACARGEAGLWDHAMVQHNHAEIERLSINVKPFLFV